MEKFEIRCGDRVVTQVESFTARYAITDYLRSLGSSDDEIEPLGADAVSWRGAVYTALAVRETAAASDESS